MVDFMFNLCVILYLGVNVTIGLFASLGWLWETLWVEQNFLDRISATIFYLPAYIIALLKYAVVFILFWVFYAILYVLQMLVSKVLGKLFKKIKKFDL